MCRATCQEVSENIFMCNFRWTSPLKEEYVDLYASGYILMNTDQILHVPQTNWGLTKYEKLDWNMFLEPSERTLGPPEVPLSDVQHRTELLCEVHSTANRASVYFSHSTFTAQTTAHTRSHAKSNKQQTAWFLCRALKSKNWPQSVLIQLVMPDFVFQKLIPKRAGRGKITLNSYSFLRCLD